ncbi:MAG: hypothetical protein AVDCRST_MAG11-3046, partial [uncultured Gemmatimonadaceae bacterium]
AVGRTHRRAPAARSPGPARRRGAGLLPRRGGARAHRARVRARRRARPAPDRWAPARIPRRARRGGRGYQRGHRGPPPPPPLGGPAARGRVAGIRARLPRAGPARAGAGPRATALVLRGHHRPGPGTGHAAPRVASPRARRAARL